MFFNICTDVKPSYHAAECHVIESYGQTDVHQADPVIREHNKPTEQQQLRVSQDASVPVTSCTWLVANCQSNADLVFLFFSAPLLPAPALTRSATSPFCHLHMLLYGVDMNALA